MFGHFKRKHVAKTDQLDKDALLAQADATREQGDLVAAINLYSRAVDLSPNEQYAFYWLATCHERTGDLAAARRFCEQGLAVDSQQIGLLLRLGSIATAMLDPRLALDCYEKAATLDPAIPDIDAMLADQYCFLGRVSEGVTHFDRALARNPGSARLQSNRLFVLNYANLLKPAQLFEEHRRWAESNESPLRKTWQPHRNAREPERKLRIGYVSPDLREHAVAFFIEPLLRCHDRTQYEVFCFDTSRYDEDVTVVHLKALGHDWRRVADLSDEALAETIRSIAIDVLVDVSGHTTMNRLLTFARKPAPIQATWLGYLNTTGLLAMDYRITDEYMDPPGETESYHTETLYRLRNASCFVPSPDSPAVSHLPALRRGSITFGSVNQWPKVSDDAKFTWSQILRALPDARLVIIASGGQNPLFAAEIVGEFTRRGARAEQLSVVPIMPIGDFLNLLQTLDVTLDPFPYGGGTTTMHSLWMGVPVVTLRGPSALARNSVGPLTEVGLQHLIASTPSAYVDIAKELASNLTELKTIRMGLRDRMRASPLMDQHAFTKNMERAYRAMWRAYCKGIPILDR